MYPAPDYDVQELRAAADRVDATLRDIGAALATRLAGLPPDHARNEAYVQAVALHAAAAIATAGALDAGASDARDLGAALADAYLQHLGPGAGGVDRVCPVSAPPWLAALAAAAAALPRRTP